MTTGKSDSLSAHRTYFASIGSGALGGELVDDVCKEFYLRRLLLCQNAFHVRVHAYVLMETQAMLLFTPSTPTGFAAFTRFLRRVYRSYYSIRFDRTQSSPYKEPTSCYLAGGQMIRDTQKFIERLAMEYGGADHPGEYRFSSYCGNAFNHRPRGLVRHRAFESLPGAGGRALEHYRRFIATPFSEEHARLLRGRLRIEDSLSEEFRAPRLEKSEALTDKVKSGTMA